MSYVDYPFSFDSRGRTSDTTTDDHIRDLIEQVLFTSPGERVNRPDLWLRLEPTRVRAEQSRARRSDAVPGARRVATVAR